MVNIIFSILFIVSTNWPQIVVNCTYQLKSKWHNAKFVVIFSIKLFTPKFIIWCLLKYSSLMVRLTWSNKGQLCWIWCIISKKGTYFDLLVCFPFNMKEKLLPKGHQFYDTNKKGSQKGNNLMLKPKVKMHCILHKKRT